MFIMRNRTTCHIKMADRARIRFRAGRPRSFEEGWSNADKRIYITKNLHRVANVAKPTRFV